MKLRRREALGLGAASLGAVLLPGCKSLEQTFTRTQLPPDPLPSPGTRRVSPAVRILNRVAYGPRPGDVTRVEKMGVAAYIEEQLQPEAMEEEPAAVWRIRSLGDILNTDTGLLFDQDDKRLVQILRQAALLRAVYSRRQLQERMVEFWGDHFNIYAFKGQGPQLKVVDDQAIIRPHALGRFRDLLGASARSAAMLGYLDNTVNRKGVPNENYARELMELHTLGINGGYTQHDVREVARCLTGWTMQRHWRRGAFHFDDSVHDDGAKQVLGAAIPPGGGVSDGERVLDIVAAHPSTARHISRKLCIYFLGDAPAVMVEGLAAVYTRTSGDIKAMIHLLLTSSSIQAAEPILKRPFDYMVSALRALNVDTDGGLPLQQHLEKMGQPLFAWPMPDGFPQRASAWTGALIPRWNFALGLAANRLPNTSLDWNDFTSTATLAGLNLHDALLELLFGCSAEDPGLASLRHCQKAHPELPEFTSLAIMSPEFQWR